MKVLVTGASSGIGRELCIELCTSEKVSILGVGRSEAALRGVKEECGGSFSYLVADLSKPEGIRRVVEVVEREFNPLDVLVNNAGFGLYKRVLETTLEELIEIAMVNFVAPIALTRELVKYMKNGSVVVNVVTGGVFVLMTKLPLYAASKAALHYASEALRRELSEKGIRLVNIYPGVVATEFHRRAGLDKPVKGVHPRTVAREIIKAIKSRKKNVYVPKYIALSKLLSGFLLPLY